MWMPSLVDRAGPKYLRIADAIAEDVYAGRLKVGERLPRQTDVAIQQRELQLWNARL